MRSISCFSEVEDAGLSAYRSGIQRSQKGAWNRTFLVDESKEEVLSLSQCTHRFFVSSHSKDLNVSPSKDKAIVKLPDKKMFFESDGQRCSGSGSVGSSNWTS